MLRLIYVEPVSHKIIKTLKNELEISKKCMA